MKVYVAQRHYDYEGFYILGVFSDMEKALEECSEDAKRGCGDWHDVEDYDVL